MKASTPIAVCSRSFSTHERLRAELTKHFHDVRFNDSGVSLKGAALVNFLTDRTAAIIGMETIDSELLVQCPQLRVISKYGVGLDKIDIRSLEIHGVRLQWQAGVNRNAVAELTISLMISLLRMVPQSQSEIRHGTFRQLRGRELGSSTVGIIGCGHIGKRVATLCRTFGARVMAYDLLDFPEFYQEAGVAACDLDSLLEKADVVTLHVPLDDSTRGMLSAPQFAKMKSNAVVINTARGGLLDEHALAIALTEHRLAGAALDVYDQEPPGAHPLLEIPNFIGTGHMGGHTEDAILAMGRAAIGGLIAA